MKQSFCRFLAFLCVLLCAQLSLAQTVTPDQKAHHGDILTRRIFSNGPLRFDTVGTTTQGLQYLGKFDTSGDYNLFINGYQAFQLTDTYWNPNASYAGPTNAWPVLSSGQGVANSGPGPDIIGSILSVNALPGVYNSGGTGIANGLSIAIMSKGPTGQIHMGGNGWLGGFTVSPPATNPGGNDAYGAPNEITVLPTAAGTNTSPRIGSSASGNGADTNIGLSVYDFGTGPISFATGNGNEQMEIDHVASAVNKVVMYGGASGNEPTIYAAGGAGNIRLQLGGSDTAGVDIVNGGQFLAGSGLAYIAKFDTTFEAPDYFHFSGGAAFGSPSHIDLGVGSTGNTDTNVAINLNPLGNAPLNIAAHIGSTLGNTSAPGTPTSCGTGSPSVTGTDTRGTITTGTAATTCTLPFGTAYATAPFCVVSDNSLVGFASVTSTSTSNMVLGISAALTGGKITYICMQ